MADVLDTFGLDMHVICTEELEEKDRKKLIKLADNLEKQLLKDNGLRERPGVLSEIPRSRRLTGEASKMLRELQGELRHFVKSAK